MWLQCLWWSHCHVTASYHWAGRNVATERTKLWWQTIQIVFSHSIVSFQPIKRICNCAPHSHHTQYKSTHCAAKEIHSYYSHTLFNQPIYCDCCRLASILEKFSSWPFVCFSRRPTGRRSHDTAAAAQPWIQQSTLDRQLLPMSSHNHVENDCGSMVLV